MDRPLATRTPSLDHAALSDVGLRRPNNQDAFAVAIASNQEIWETRGHLFMVADGMGAHAAGELASKIATDVVPLAYHKHPARSWAEALHGAILDANAQIHSRGQASLDFKGMGTTSTALVLSPEGAFVAHVGDSRAYRLRGHQLDQLTFDHSLVWEMRQAGQFPADIFPGYISKNIITRSLGPNPTVQVDLEGPFPIAAGDTFLLCTDGLSGQVTDAELGAVLVCLPPCEAAQALVDLANLRGGPDNITVIVIRATAAEASAGVAAPSERSPAAHATRRTHLLLWLLAGALLLGALGLVAVGEPLPALVGVILAVVTSAVAIAWRYGSPSPAVSPARQPLGRGPYSTCTCLPDGEFVGRLAEIAQQLRDGAAERDWVLDWSRFNGFVEQAATAAQVSDHVQAAQAYLHAISFMMTQLKRRGSSAEG